MIIFPPAMPFVNTKSALGMVFYWFVAELHFKNAYATSEGFLRTLWGLLLCASRCHHTNRKGCSKRGCNLTRVMLIILTQIDLMTRKILILWQMCKHNELHLPTLISDPALYLNPETTVKTGKGRTHESALTRGRSITFVVFIISQNWTISE